MIGFTTKLKQRIVDLETKASKDADKARDLETQYNVQLTLRNGEVTVMKNRLSNADTQIKTWESEYGLKETEINLLHEINNTLVADKRDLEKSLGNLQNVINKKEEAIKKLELKVIELRNPKKVILAEKLKKVPVLAKKKKRVASAKQKAYYNRGTTKQA